ncbi:MAG: hypothetical protein ACI4TV_05970 [Paludibacteraceae bacterium]
MLILDPLRLPEAGKKTKKVAAPYTIGEGTSPPKESTPWSVSAQAEA